MAEAWQFQPALRLCFQRMTVLGSEVIEIDQELVYEILVRQVIHKILAEQVYLRREAYEEDRNGVENECFCKVDLRSCQIYQVEEKKRKEK